jgi:hypothetical protein
MAVEKAKRIPPQTLEVLEMDLAHPKRSVYVYLGGEKDLGWRVARAACESVGATVAYLVSDSAALGSRLSEWTGSRRPRGIVFGFGDVPRALLSKGEAEAYFTVLDTIQAANEATE